MKSEVTRTRARSRISECTISQNERINENSVRNTRTSRGSPSATGEDGVKSLSLALSVLQSAHSGRETLVDLTV